jgi:multiple sugar transport system permease protein
MTRYDLLSPPRWVGFDNYTTALTQDPVFWQSVANTGWMIVIALPIRIVLSLTVAMLMARPRGGLRWYRTAVYLPVMVPPVAGILTFVFLLRPDGPLNRVLGWLHLPQPFWFQDPAFAKWAVLLLGLWGMGDAVIIFLAGLLDVPTSLIEAAMLDGANPFQRFVHITLPMISPVIFYQVITGVIVSMQTFSEGYVASGATAGNSGALGAPENSLLFYAVALYQAGFRNFRMGYASAMAWMLFAVTLVLTLLVLVAAKRFVYYGGDK